MKVINYQQEINKSMVDSLEWAGVSSIDIIKALINCTSGNTLEISSIQEAVVILNHFFFEMKSIDDFSDGEPFLYIDGKNSFVSVGFDTYHKVYDNKVDIDGGRVFIKLASSFSPRYLSWMQAVELKK